MRRTMIFVACGLAMAGAYWAFGDADAVKVGEAAQVAAKAPEPAIMLAPALAQPAEAPVSHPTASSQWDPLRALQVARGQTDAGVIAPGSHAPKVWQEIQKAALKSGHLMWFHADWSMDGVLDVRDAELFVAAMRAEDAKADLNGDGRVDGEDLALFVEAYRGAQWQHVLSC